MRGGTRCAWCRTGSPRDVIHKGKWIRVTKKLADLQSKSTRAANEAQCSIQRANDAIAAYEAALEKEGGVHPRGEVAVIIGP